MAFLLSERLHFKRYFMKKKLFLFCLCSIAFSAIAQNSSFDEKARAYISQYASWAIEEQQRVGIPASITLAQGIYETGAGESVLATQANNHFGIKCKKEWRGETFAHTDDAPNECFRKYKSAKDSYKDHSDYLKNSVRYAELFSFDVSNYMAWAKGLKKCGYATNPAYAQKLIKMVEDYDLQQYTLAANGQRKNEIVPVEEKELKSVSEEQSVPEKKAIPITEAADKAQAVVMANADDGTVRVHNIRAVYCQKGELLLDKAMKYNVRYARLLEINELNDEPLPRAMYVYLEQKNSKGAHPTYTVQEGETIESIAHNEGMASRQLRIFNLMAQNEQPVAGSILKLQEQSDERPNTYKMQRVLAPIADKNYRLEQPKKTDSKDDYVPTKKVVQVSEVIEIGYGAERPNNFKVDPSELQAETVQVPAIEKTVVEDKKPQIETVQAPVIENTVVEDKKPQLETVQVPVIEKRIVEEKKTIPAEPMDEFALLKARLDKAVYSKSSRSKIKVVSSDSSSVPMPALVKKASLEVPSKSVASTAGQVFHVVEKGDTGFSIAQKYGIKIKQLNEWNNLNFEGIKIGQKLRVR
jgi:LysM repeat protein